MNEPFIISHPRLGIRQFDRGKKQGLGLVLIPVRQIIIRTVPFRLVGVMAGAIRIAALIAMPAQ